MTALNSPLARRASIANLAVLNDPRARKAATLKGTTARYVRASMRRSLLAGELNVSDWFALADADPDSIAALTPLVQMIRGVPGLRDRGRAELWLLRLGMSPTRTVRGLGRHQRERLAGAVDQHLCSTAG